MYETDKAELAKLQALFGILEKQYNAIMEERRLQEEENARRQREEQEQTNAVTTIQAAWWAYQFRKAMAKKVKKDKKTEKKGKENKWCDVVTGIVRREHSWFRFLAVKIIAEFLSFWKAYSVKERIKAVFLSAFGAYF